MILYFTYVGDTWHKMRRLLEPVFHRDSVAQSVEQCQR